MTQWLPQLFARIPAPVQTKIMVTFLSVVVMFVALGGAGLAVLRKSDQRAADLVDLQRRIAAYGQLQQDTTAELYSITMSVLGSDERTFQATLRRLTQFGYSLDRLQFVAGDEAELIERVRENYERLIQVVTSTAEFIRAGKTAEGLKFLRAEADPIAARLERVTNELVNRAEADMVSAADLSNRAYRVSQYAVMAIALVSVLLVLLLGYAISRSLTVPLKEMHTSFKAIAAGQFTGRLEVVNRDEMGDLADNLNRMSADLDQLYRQLEEASEQVVERNRMLESLSNQLSKYLSPQVYSSIFLGEQSVEIASKRKKLTVFFSDIADFTGTTDSLESEELTNLLNHYLTEMSMIAFDFGATIDKYVGDSIIAFFGDPETRGVKEDARACVNMAITMQQRMRELQTEWLDMGLEKPFELRIGINTGFCTVGNFGSADRMDYTIIGNEVNLAARLESHAEVGGILMAHETHSLVKDTVMAEEGDTLTVKGFAKPLRTYQVVGLYDDLAESGGIIRKEQDGVRVLVDLKKGDKTHAIQAIKDVLSQLED
jgi:class 3 adenylate cyclase